jgi:hypothetical protein
MEITTFLATLRKRWYIPALFLAVAAIGMFLYHRLTDMQTAQATVAVLDPLAAKAGAAGYQEAQVTFDAVVKSNQLAQRVGTRLGIPGGLVSKRLSASVIPTLSTFNASPLYSVKGQGTTKAEAIRLTNAAITEARLLYIELNTANPEEVRRAMKPELDRLQTELAQARRDYDAFTATNNTANLPGLVDRQMNLVSSLQQSLAQTRAAEGAAGIKNGRNSQALAKELAKQQAQLDDLNAKESQFRNLSFSLQLAQDRVTQYSQAEQATIIGEHLPVQVQVKILDTASIQSPFFFLAITYATAVLLALLVGMSVIYVMGLRQKPYQTADELARMFGTPVLVRVPRISA